MHGFIQMQTLASMIRELGDFRLIWRMIMKQQGCMHMFRLTSEDNHELISVLERTDLSRAKRLKYVKKCRPEVQIIAACLVDNTLPDNEELAEVVTMIREWAAETTRIVKERFRHFA